MLQLHDKGTLLFIRVKPKAKTRAFKFQNDSAELIVRVKASPIRGRANAEVVKLLAKQIGISTDRISIMVGATSFKKTLLIEGLSPDEVLAALRD